LEEYLVGVLAGEASVEDEFEALKAQAVVSRTFSLKNRGRHAPEDYDFCSTTHCQRFVMSKSKNTGAAARRAVEVTAGEILQDQLRQIADVYFHAACGGITANIETLWGAPAPAYLRGVRDDFCATMPRRRWMQKIPANQLAKALQSDERTDPGVRLESIVVSKRDATGRAEMITIEGSRRRAVRGWDFKIIVGRSLGWQMIKSSRFEVARAGGDFVFRGGGFGHGLGLCQEGAHVAARRGMNYRQILNHYFPGARLNRSAKAIPPTAVGGGGKSDRIPPAEAGGLFRPNLQKVRHFFESHQRKLVDCSSPTCWRRKLRKAGFEQSTGFRWWDSGGILAVRRLGLNDPPPAGGGIWEKRRSLSSEHFRASFPSNADTRSIESALRVLESAREDLLRRLERASLRIAEPAPFEVVIHATTADFIAETGQSGWAAGATRGRRIELQPLPLLRRRGILNTTLRHELAHAVIEVLGQSRAPRWLAEGLAIHVAAEAAKLPRIEDKKRLSREELERRLARPASVAEMRELYAMAYREVRAMIRAEGEAAVWRRVARFKELSVV
jgi:SpoIID/LytB domain protein